MLLLDNRGQHDPHLNLALEEYAVRQLDPAPGYLLFYVNEPSVIVGKNQNTVEEVNADYVEANGVHVVRRISGGGAVYHDHGNLNFSFLGPYTPGTFLQFERFTGPVVKALHRLGVPAELTGRNDLVVEGRKISGNAQFAAAHSMFSHGTLLFDSRLEDVVAALDVASDKYESKGLKSVRSRVANIAEFLDPPLTLEEFRAELVATFEEDGALERRELTPAQWSEVERLAEEKYRAWEWNYGRSPDFNVQQRARLEVGEIDARIQVHSGRITEIRIFGDFLGLRDVAEIESALRGVRYDRDAVSEALASHDVREHFGGLENEDLVRFLTA